MGSLFNVGHIYIHSSYKNSLSLQKPTLAIVTMTCRWCKNSQFFLWFLILYFNSGSD